MTIRLNVLGAPICLLDERELADLPAHRTRFAIFVYLAIERSAPRDEVAAMFWPDSDDERARHALSQSLYELKRVLGDDWVATRAGRLTVSSKVNADTAEFGRLLGAGRLDEALRLYRGPFLDGYVLPNCSDFQTWADRQRAQHERAHRKARRDVVESLIQQGKWNDAIGAARSWVDVDPLEDEANHRLIELLALTGARAEALNTFAVYEERLRSELDVSPLDHTRELIQSIRENKYQSATTPTPVSAPQGAAPAWSTTVSEAAGRQAEVAAPATGQGVLRRFRRQLWIVGGAMVTMLALGLDLWSIAGRDVQVSLTWPLFTRKQLDLDTTRFVVLPFDYDKSVSGRLDLQEQILMREALGSWDGISLVDVYQTGEWIERLKAPLNSRAIQRLCTALNAGRYLRGRVSQLRDTLIVHATLFDANRNGVAIADRSVRIGRDGVDIEKAFASLAEALLFPTDPLTKAAQPTYGTHSRAARRAYARAMTAVSEWDLTRAESELAAAVRADPQHAPAFFWLAQTRSWLRYDVAQWSFAAERAHAQKDHLNAQDGILADALYALAQGDLPAACRHYQGAAANDRQNFAAWYGWADCLQRDEVVQPDSTSPSGWRFRTSYHAAVQAYRQAFELLPSVHRAFRASNYEPLRRLLKTQRTALRVGSRSGAQPVEFAAYPELHGDTLRFVPHPIDSFRTRSFDVSAVTAGVHRQRQVFRAIASTWATAYPESAEAVEAVAVALELLGHQAALDTLVKARSLTKGEADRVRLAVSEVFLRLKYAAPHDLRGVRRARLLADSILQSQRGNDPPHATLLAALAVLTGRSDAALHFARNSAAVQQSRVPSVLAPAAMPLLVYTALGQPRDSIAVYEERLADLIDSALADEERERARLDWLLRPSYLAMPVYPFRHLGQIAADDPLWMTYHALANRDVAGALSRLEQQQRRRRGVPTSQLTLDVIYPEAWLLYAAQQPQLAADRLDRTLANMHAWPPFERAGELVEVGAWVRAMALRAELAAKLGDRAGARTWARPVIELWRNADRPLRPAVRRLRAISD
jgi:DNA-binding SARP family transcriptional activator